MAGVYLRILAPPSAACRYSLQQRLAAETQCPRAVVSPPHLSVLWGWQSASECRQMGSGGSGVHEPLAGCLSRSLGL